MSIVWALIIGLVVGAVAKLLMPGKDPGGFIVTSLIGVTGSIIATFIGRALGWYREGQAAGLIASILGAMLLLFIYRLFIHRTARTKPPACFLAASIREAVAMNDGAGKYGSKTAAQERSSGDYGGRYFMWNFCGISNHRHFSMDICL